MLRPYSAFKLSIRLRLRSPPTPPRRASALLEKDPPHGAKVTFEVDKHANGWDAPPLASWLEEAADALRGGTSEASPRATWVRAVAFRSWACSAGATRTRSS